MLAIINIPSLGIGIILATAETPVVERAEIEPFFRNIPIEDLTAIIAPADIIIPPQKNLRRPKAGRNPAYLAELLTANVRASAPLNLDWAAQILTFT